MDVDVIAAIPGRIDRTLALRSQFAMAGVGFTDEAVWTKAFRLKHFGRCPRCDAGLRSMREPRDNSTELWCECGFSAKIYDTVYTRVEDTDDVIIDLVKEELGLLYVVEKTKPSKWSTTTWVSAAIVAIVVVAIIVVAVVAYS